MNRRFVGPTLALTLALLSLTGQALAEKIPLPPDEGCRVLLEKAGEGLAAVAPDTEFLRALADHKRSLQLSVRGKKSEKPLFDYEPSLTPVTDVNFGSGGSVSAFYQKGDDRLYVGARDSVASTIAHLGATEQAALRQLDQPPPPGTGLYRWTGKELGALLEASAQAFAEARPAVSPPPDYVRVVKKGASHSSRVAALASGVTTGIAASGLMMWDFGRSGGDIGAWFTGGIDLDALAALAVFSAIPTFAAVSVGKLIVYFFGGSRVSGLVPGFDLHDHVAGISRTPAVSRYAGFALPDGRQVSLYYHAKKLCLYLWRPPAEAVPRK